MTDERYRAALFSLSYRLTEAQARMVVLESMSFVLLQLLIETIPPDHRKRRRAVAGLLDPIRERAMAVAAGVDPEASAAIAHHTDEILSAASEWIGRDFFAPYRGDLDPPED